MVQPSVSTEGSVRTIAFCFAIFLPQHGVNQLSHRCIVFGSEYWIFWLFPSCLSLTVR